MIKNFEYEKMNGDKSNRLVWELRPPSDKMLALDLTEFDDEEVEHYVKQLEGLEQYVKGAIKEMGLASQYRNFLAEGIKYD